LLVQNNTEIWVPYLLECFVIFLLLCS